MQPYPRFPDLIWPGHLHGTGCLSAGGMDTGFPTVGWYLCLCLGFAVTPPNLAGVLGGSALVRVSAAPRHSWLGCWGLCVFVCVLRPYPATPCWAARGRCACLGSGFGCAPPLPAGCLGLYVLVCALRLVPRHSWLGRAVRVCVLGLGFQLRPATPSWGVWVCVCLCACSACTPPLLAGMCGVGECASARTWLRPATLCLGVGVCMRLCACCACTLSLPVGVFGVGVCVWARVSAAPRHSSLGCLGACLFACVLRLYPATLGRGVQCGCVRLGWGFGNAPQLLAGVFGCTCVFLCLLRLYPATPGWVVRCVLCLGFRLRPATPRWIVGLCVCSSARSACTPPLLAGVRGVGVLA